jgi:NADH-quinone oxidoreductase subunit G
MADLVNLTVDGVAVAVPKGTVIVDAAKKINNEIPVFCYHPKMKPVGMCRMCLVEVGTPKVDPATKQVVMGDDGKPVIAWMPKLQTACTTPVSEGMAVRTATPQVNDAREDVLEFLLTSHPLDCPICDKGGECPLQNLTLAHGPGVSRFDYADKQHNDKHVPLGDLIYLDRERCIQCARCIRFEDELAGDPVLGFHERGRKMEIVTLSDPGFDSYFSGNTTDICPVGALTTADFRFKARPWELDTTQSICTHCPVGCNIALNTRLDTKTGNHEIKRVMPRQNEAVNEIWICDKGRFVHHFTRAQDRLKRPLIRKDGGLQEATWEQAIQLITEKVLAAGSSVVGLIGDRIANEDAFLFGKLLKRLGGVARITPELPAAYADIVRAYGVGAETNLAQVGKDDVVLVVNADVEEQAPVWFLRLKAAVTDRGATLIVAHMRGTKMHRYARKIGKYDAGRAAQWAIENLTADKYPELKDAKNLICVFGDEQLAASGARALAQHLANLLIETNHAGKANSGLLALYPHANTQGVWDQVSGVGFQLSTPGPRTPPSRLALAWLVGVGADEEVPQAQFTVVQDLFLTAHAQNADVVLPALSFAEREGTFTSGDRRVQRFYRALAPLGHAKPDWWVFQEVAKQLGADWNFWGAQQIFDALAAEVAQYQGLSYAAISKNAEQWPPLGREDLYYGGTVYDSTGGMGVRYAADAERAGFVAKTVAVSAPEPSIDALNRKPRTLYQHGELISRSHVLQTHVVGGEPVKIPLAAQ